MSLFASIVGFACLLLSAVVLLLGVRNVRRSSELVGKAEDPASIRFSIRLSIVATIGVLITFLGAAYSLLALADWELAGLFFCLPVALGFVMMVVSTSWTKRNGREESNREQVATLKMLGTPYQRWFFRTFDRSGRLSLLEKSKPEHEDHS